MAVSTAVCYADDSYSHHHHYHGWFSVCSAYTGPYEQQN